MEDFNWVAWAEAVNNACRRIWERVARVTQALCDWFRKLAEYVFEQFDRAYQNIIALVPRYALPFRVSSTTPINRKRGFYRIYPNGRNRRIWVRLN